MDLILEREISRNTVASVSLLVSLGRRLPTFVDTNLAFPTQTTRYTVVGGDLNGEVFQFPRFTVRPDSNFGRITEIRSTIKSEYEAVVLQLNRRLHKRVQFQNNYTFSKATDTGQGSQTFTTGNVPLNPFDYSLESGRTNFDIPHRFVSSVVWEPKFFGDDSDEVVRAIFNGFTIAPVVQIASGRPNSAGVSGNAPACNAGNNFCAGHDLSEMIGRDPETYRHIFDVCCELMETIQEIPQPVIAQVHGVATAAGCQLAATCDLVVASEVARFATPGVRIGLFCSTPMVALSRAVGQKRSMEMLLTGEFISAEEALAEGLVNRVVSAEELETETRSLAAKIAEASPLVVGIGKQAFYRQLEMPTEQAYAYTKEVMSFNASFADAQEGMGAFLEKRKPEWKGR